MLNVNARKCQCGGENKQIDTYVSRWVHKEDCLINKAYWWSYQKSEINAIESDYIFRDFYSAFIDWVDLVDRQKGLPGQIKLYFSCLGGEYEEAVLDLEDYDYEN